jgi:hypothetical protein
VSHTWLLWPFLTPLMPRVNTSVEHCRTLHVPNPVVDSLGNQC